MIKSNKRKYAIYGFIFFLVLAVKSVVYIDIPVEKLKEKYANSFSKFVDNRRYASTLPFSRKKECQLY